MENNNIIYINNKEYLSFDTMHETNYSLSNTTSQKHVEQGGWANDSKQRNPATIKINAGIGAGYNYNDKIDNAITLLTKLAKSKQLVDIVTTNQAYVNCSLDEFSHKNDADNIGLTAELTFRQIMLVASQYSQIKNNKPKNKQNQATQQQGAQQAKLRSSIGNDIVQGIKKTFSGK